MAQFLISRCDLEPIFKMVNFKWVSRADRLAQQLSRRVALNIRYRDAPTMQNDKRAK